MSKLGKLTLSHCAAGALLVTFLLTPGAADAGLLKNDLDASVCMYYFGLCDSKVIIPAHGSLCFKGFVDFPEFLSSPEGLVCPIPFMTSLTTVKFYYKNGFPVCCRDCISNACKTADTLTYTPQGIRLDADSDGVISKAEFVAAATQDFHRGDLNEDNLLSRAEMSYEEDTPIPMDTNKDGFVSRDEVVAGIINIFDDLDKDGNGVLDDAENGG